VTIGVHQVAPAWLFDPAPPLDVVANVGQSGTRRTLASSEPYIDQPVAVPAVNREKATR
jgi:hypothetical protein